MDEQAQQHELDPKHYWLRGTFQKDGTINHEDWRTYYTSTYSHAPNGELVDSRYWALDQINELIFQRFGDHRGKYKELPKELDNPLAKSFYQLFQKENGRILCNFPNGVTTTRTNLTRQEFDRRSGPGARFSN